MKHISFCLKHFFLHQKFSNFSLVTFRALLFVCEKTVLQIPGHLSAFFTYKKRVTSGLQLFVTKLDPETVRYFLKTKNAPHRGMIFTEQSYI